MCTQPDEVIATTFLTFPLTMATTQRHGADIILRSGDGVAVNDAFSIHLAFTNAKGWKLAQDFGKVVTR